MSPVAARVPLRWPVLLALLVALLVPVGPVSARAHHLGDGTARAAVTATPARADSGTRRAAVEALVAPVSTMVAWPAVAAAVPPAVTSPRPAKAWTYRPEVVAGEAGAQWSPRSGRGPPVTTV